MKRRSADGEQSCGNGSLPLAFFLCQKNSLAFFFFVQISSCVLLVPKLFFIQNFSGVFFVAKYFKVKDFSGIPRIILNRPIHQNTQAFREFGFTCSLYLEGTVCIVYGEHTLANWSQKQFCKRLAQLFFF